MKKLNRVNSEILRLKNICVQYNNATVLENINLSVYKTDFLGVIGPNGGGKTTLLKVMLGLIRPTTGKVEFLGNNPDKKQKHMGYVPQNFYFDRTFPISVRDVVLMGRLARGGLLKKFNDNDKKIVDNALEKVGIYTIKDRQIGQLSGGQIQRVLIARALATEPQILFFDEPTSNIDRRNLKLICSLLKIINKNIPIVIVSHDIEYISTFVNKIACLNKRLLNKNLCGVNKKTIEFAYNCSVNL
ncbi:MAG: ABC transporter ATP-binding protein [Clostridiales bacterium]|nr:ABC transporter ATP-binding protein [Clostridiales bacterium]MCF8021843.1 ABC transporter ATP-binding protein [Clostridiales bacterium]